MVVQQHTQRNMLCRGCQAQPYVSISPQLSGKIGYPLVLHENCHAAASPRVRVCPVDSWLTWPGKQCMNGNAGSCSLPVSINNRETCKHLTRMDACNNTGIPCKNSGVPLSAMNVLQVTLDACCEVRHSTGRETIMTMLQYGLVGGQNEYS